MSHQELTGIRNPATGVPIAVGYARKRLGLGSFATRSCRCIAAKEEVHDRALMLITFRCRTNRELCAEPLQVGASYVCRSPVLSQRRGRRPRASARSVASGGHV